MALSVFPRVRQYALIGVVIPLLAGCGQTLFMMDDVIVADGHRTVLVATAMRDHVTPFQEPLAGVEVRFLAGGRSIAKGVTDHEGRAVIKCQLGPGVQQIEARARIQGQAFTTTGTVYHWSPYKTVVAVDLDETLSKTRYSDLFWGQWDPSAPLDGAHDAMWALAQDYEILYISARSNFLQNKTRQWLQANEFPPGPYLGAVRWDACLEQAAAKRRLLADLRTRCPNVLIGIGDKRADDQAFAPNGMLTFIVNPQPSGAFTKNCVMMKDWAGVQEFFAAHRPRLQDPDVLASIIKHNGSNLRAVFNEPADEVTVRQASGVGAGERQPPPLVLQATDASRAGS